MEPRILLAVGLVLVAAVVAYVIERRRPDPPLRGAHPVPSRLHRSDFAGSERPWLVVLFSSRTCESCAEVATKLDALSSDEVAVQEVEYSTDRALHERYAVEAVPMTLVADADGVVRVSFTGRVTATDLWAAVAEAREAGSSPEPGLGRVESP